MGYFSSKNPPSEKLRGSMREFWFQFVGVLDRLVLLLIWLSPIWVWLWCTSRLSMLSSLETHPDGAAEWFDVLAGSGGMAGLILTAISLMVSSAEHVSIKPLRGTKLLDAATDVFGKTFFVWLAVATVAFAGYLTGHPRVRPALHFLLYLAILQTWRCGLGIVGLMRRVLSA